jgi:hypothetical protein
MEGLLVVDQRPSWGQADWKEALTCKERSTPSLWGWSGTLSRARSFAALIGGLYGRGCDALIRGGRLTAQRGCVTLGWRRYATAATTLRERKRELYRDLSDPHLLLQGEGGLIRDLDSGLRDPHLLGVPSLAESFDAHLSDADGHQRSTNPRFTPRRVLVSQSTYTWVLRHFTMYSAWCLLQ